MTLAFPTFTAGMVLSISLIMAIGPQNAHVLRMGLQRQHLWLTVAVCAVADIALISLGVLGLAQLGGLSDKLMGALVGAGVLFLSVYGWQAFQRFLHPRAVAIEGDSSVVADPVTRRQAVLSALAFSWLNPHAWLDTAVLIGTASLAYGQGSTVFGLGAALPLVAVAYASRSGFERWRDRALHSMDRIKKGFAVLLGLAGVAILMGWDKLLEAWALDHLPDAWLRLSNAI